ncbi:MAG: Mrp/NBP35 family ATP-binding protein [Phycisphaerales bacterium]
MGATKDQLMTAARSVPHPDGGTLGDAGSVVNVAACDGVISARVSLGETAGQKQRHSTGERLIHDLINTSRAHGQDVETCTVEFVDHDGDVIDRVVAGKKDAPPKAATPEQSGPPAPQADTPQPPKGESLPGVKHIIAVGAGKGGVGKSTVAVNLAVGLARKGHAVGLLDGDIYGPSLPTMLGLDALDQQAIEGRLQPFYVHGVKAVTMGKLVEPDKPLIWRGPMAHGAFNQLTARTDWGELDYLIIDLPPGTGDVPLTMAQSLSLAGAVIVCTPQKVAQDDASRAAKMFAQLGVDVLGVVENMSFFIGDDGKEYDLFGRGGAQKMAQRLGLPFLGSVPINTALRVNGDSGDPVKNFEPEHAGGEALPKALEGVVNQLESQVALATMGKSRPTLSIS